LARRITVVLSSLITTDQLIKVIVSQEEPSFQTYISFETSQSRMYLSQSYPLIKLQPMPVSSTLTSITSSASTALAPNCIRYIKTMGRKAQGLVKVQDTPAAPFPYERGVRQVDALLGSLSVLTNGRFLKMCNITLQYPTRLRTPRTPYQ
jgi:hypothetical protein